MSTERITKEELKDMATEVLNFIESQGVKDVKDLEGKTGTALEVAGKEGHVIRVESRPSKNDTMACTLSYRVSGKGTPIEIRLNSKLGYTRTFVKGDLQMNKDYSYFTTDDFGNRAYERQTAECSIGSLKEGLAIILEK